MENKNENFDVMKYPEGYNTVRDEMLAFLPPIPEVREDFMRFILQWFVQW